MSCDGSASSSRRCARSRTSEPRTAARHELETFEDWVTASFGTPAVRRLLPLVHREGLGHSRARRSASEWAAQRIKTSRSGRRCWRSSHLAARPVTTLIEEFHYRGSGPGQMWEAFHAQRRGAGIPVHLDHRVLAIHHDDDRVAERRRRARTASGRASTVDAVLSSIALSDLVLSLDPAPPDEIVEAAARGLRYRSLCLVALVIDRGRAVPGQLDLPPRPGIAGRPRPELRRLERGDGACRGRRASASSTSASRATISGAADEEAVALATDELARIGLIDPAEVIDGVKVACRRRTRCTTRYREDVADCVATSPRFENLKTFGRNGLHRYNNQDHSMWTAILATLNLLDGTDARRVVGEHRGRVPRGRRGGRLAARHRPRRLGRSAKMVGRSADVWS